MNIKKTSLFAFIIICLISISVIFYGKNEEVVKANSIDTNIKSVSQFAGKPVDLIKNTGKKLNNHSILTDGIYNYEVLDDGTVSSMVKLDIKPSNDKITYEQTIAKSNDILKKLGKGKYTLSINKQNPDECFVKYIFTFKEKDNDNINTGNNITIMFSNDGQILNFVTSNQDQLNKVNFKDIKLSKEQAKELAFNKAKKFGSTDFLNKFTEVNNLSTLSSYQYNLEFDYCKTRPVWIFNMTKDNSIIATYIIDAVTGDTLLSGEPKIFYQ